MNRLTVLGILLIVCGSLFFFCRKKLLLPRSMQHRIKKPHRFILTISIMLLLAGIYSVLAPVLTVMMGADYWILYYAGLLGCIMLLILFLLPKS
ncbi:hypothetical protein NIE88_13160 [Sporolactobacillus shoreicorticis]|uniref:Uncharacterized protein n=1 Tax=Sporolactobacillus shoreicorticis TaxID=1923877 RepID=A0ABW5S649_9BACL|nr:hypothetical protein [Sporolactobacillus shoreicorticis]MCO7126715.1 hypothetical protein [Sporolactobacillus shoreicorticis]